MAFTKKSGGVISVMALGVLILICLFAHSVYLRMNNAYYIEKEIDESLKLHYLVLESIYYLRNEIYDETYYDLHYQSDDVKIDIEINCLFKTGKIMIKYNDVYYEKEYKIDKDNKTIYQ